MRAIAAVVAVLVVVGAAAQGVSPLAESAWTTAPDTASLNLDARFWEGGGNWSASAVLRMGVDARTEVSLRYVDFDISGEDPIGPSSQRAVRASDYSALGVVLKARLFDSARPAVALLLGADFPTSRRTGTNTSTGGYAFATGAIPFVGLTMQWGDEFSRWRWVLQPQAIFFDDWWTTDTGGRLRGFTDVFALTLGVRCRLDDRWSLFGDVTAILSGDNSINPATGKPDDELVWAAGAAWSKPDGSWSVELFATDAAGATPASCVIAAPDGSTALGVALRLDL